MDQHLLVKGTSLTALLQVWVNASARFRLHVSNLKYTHSMGRRNVETTNDRLGERRGTFNIKSEILHH